jgi:colanic acid/amylovoran biosynthesis protein
MGTPASCGNRGVAALGASLVNLCAHASHGGEMVLLLGNRDNQSAPFRVDGSRRLIPVVHCRLSPRSKPRDHLFWILLMSLLYRAVPFAGVRAAIARSTPWIKTVAESEIVGDVRGGDSFSDIYGLRGFLSGFLMAWTVLLVRGTMVQFPQTYGPYKSRVARWLARFILKRSSVIIARDKESQRVAQDLVGPSRKVLLSPDVAFSLDAVLPERFEFDPPLPLTAALPLRSGERVGVRCSGDSPFSILHPPSSGPKPLGLNVNGLMFNGGYTRNNMFGLKLDYVSFLSELIVTGLAQHSGELWLIPHTYAPPGHVESDNEAAQKVRSSLPVEIRDRVRIVTGEYDAHELKGIIGQCEFFIGSRMHSCIAALSQGVPCVGVAYSRKFAGVFESVGMQEWVVDARASANDGAIARIVSLFQQRDGVRSELVRRANQARQQLTGIFRDLVDKSASESELLPTPSVAAQPAEVR